MTKETKQIINHNLADSHHNFELIVSNLLGSSKNAVKEYNTVYRQVSTNLLVAAGILLAFSTQFIAQLGSSSIKIKLMATCIIISLTLSMAFGIIQQLMEAEFFRGIADDNTRVGKKIIKENNKNADELKGMLSALSDKRGNAVKRWASVVQLSLLAIALLLIVATTSYYLFT